MNSKFINISGEKRISINEARRILKSVSKATLYRWSKNGIDNDMAKELLTLYFDQRVIPATKKWHGVKITERDRLITPSGNELQPHQIDQYSWVTKQWFQSVESIQQISATLDEIRDLAADRQEKSHTNIISAASRFRP